jgi:hypothetical protein
MVELSVEARQGDSGGPILNNRGELAGVLFGASNGTTLGSFSGRVGEFLTSLAPDIGGKAETTLASAETAELPTGNLRETTCDQWHSAVTPPIARGAQATSTALLEPPPFESLHESKSEMAALTDTFSGQPTCPEDTTASLATPNAHHKPSLFEKIKSGLAALGLFAIVAMFLKAAG